MAKRGGRKPERSQHPAAVENLQGMLDALRTAGGDPSRVTIGDMQACLGRRSFGPLLAFAGLPPMTPLGGIPGLPTIMAAIILLTAGQMLVGMRHIWIPDLLRRQSIDRAGLVRAIDLALPAARFVDRFIRPRLVFLTRPPGIYAVAATCCLLALTMPPLELVPFTGGIPALPVVAFGLAMIARDGMLVVLGFLFVILSVTGLSILGTTLL
jgi:hypothetical protein